jgi:gamma-glutamyltranspeptidase / glutathione hydrolase
MTRRPRRCSPIPVLLLGLAAACSPAQPPQPPDAHGRQGATGDVARTSPFPGDLHAIPAGWPYPLHGEPARSARGMVTSDSDLATHVGVAILAAGGNAVDAAIATAFALAVVYPEAGNVGGGGFLVLRTPAGEEAALDFREKAPLAASRDMFLDAQGDVTDRSITGHLAVGVPGAVAGLWEAHRRFGSLPWRQLVEPAIRLATDGFVVDDGLHRSIATYAERLRRFPGSAALFLPGGEPLAAGTVWRNPDLAAVLRRIAAQGPAGFYEGETAALIVAEMRRGDGLITRDDLRSYRAVWREPVAFEYRRHRIVSMPPASSGGLTLGLIAGILEGYDLRALGWNTPATLHLTAEAMRRAFAERNHHLGDPDFVPIPRERFLDPAFVARHRDGVDRERASPSLEVGPGAGASATSSHHTTHLSVVDASGGAAALTTTINLLYGSAVTVAGAGFLLNNEMDDFAAKPGTPNVYGLVQGEANAIQPGKRMLSAMTPTLVIDPAGQVVVVTGARGGPRIISGVWQVISNIVDHRFDVLAAVNAPRIHHQHLPDVLYFERDGIPDGVADALRDRGHTVQPRGGYIGVAPTLLRDARGWTGVADPRRPGLAAGE